MSGRKEYLDEWNERTDVLKEDLRVAVEAIDALLMCSDTEQVKPGGLNEGDIAKLKSTRDSLHYAASRY